MIKSTTSAAERHSLFSMLHQHSWKLKAHILQPSGNNTSHVNLPYKLCSAERGAGICCWEISYFLSSSVKCKKIPTCWCDVKAGYTLTRFSNATSAEAASRCVCSLTCFSRADVSVLESAINQSLLEQAKRVKTEQHSNSNHALVRGRCSVSSVHSSAFL